MKKFQLPVIGGIRKVLVQPTNTPGTTITELGSGEIGLAQLAALITQIQAAQQNTGGGNIGDGTEAFLAVGPGLSGGGPMLGTVQLRLTGPIPALLAEDGADGDPGPPGVAGKAGATGGTGPAGPAIFLDAEPGLDGDPGPPGPQGPIGATGSQGPAGTGAQGPPGVATFLDAEPGADGDQGPPGPIGPSGAAGSAGSTGAIGPAGVAIFLEAEQGADGDPGPQGLQGLRGLTGAAGPAGAQTMMAEDTWTDEEIFRGPASAQGALSINGQCTITGASGATPLVINTPSDTQITINALNAGQFSTIVFAQGLVSKAQFFADFTGNSFNFITQVAGAAINFKTANNVLAATLTSTQNLLLVGNLSLAGAIPAVTAGRTDIGTTTTTTVITTAGGVAIPVLAATMWRVNVNGVAYGVPCFAL